VFRHFRFGHVGADKTLFIFIDQGKLFETFAVEHPTHGVEHFLFILGIF